MDTAVFDLDGTLVDTNYQHTLAWFRAFRRFGITLPAWEIHRHIGMGGDQLVGALAGDDAEAAHGDDLRRAWTEEFQPMLGEIVPLAGAHALLAEVRRRGFRLVLASSGESDQVEHHLDLIGARDLVEAWTTSADVQATKPAPDLVEVAVAKVDGADAVMVGDSTWDIETAKRTGVPSIAVRTGGFSDAELRDAGAAQVFGSLEEFRSRLDETALRAATPR